MEHFWANADLPAMIVQGAQNCQKAGRQVGRPLGKSDSPAYQHKSPENVIEYSEQCSDLQVKNSKIEHGPGFHKTVCLWLVQYVCQYFFFVLTKMFLFISIKHFLQLQIVPPYPYLMYDTQNQNNQICVKGIQQVETKHDIVTSWDKQVELKCYRRNQQYFFFLCDWN